MLSSRGNTRHGQNYLSRITTINNLNVFIDYYKTLCNYKNFLLQGKKGNFNILGTNHVKKQYVPKAHIVLTKY